ncbi:hypothetical protein [Streptomyces sp. NPDC047706]|uniref:hypothetical protein n=1 Tax=Streptomyces sp. NPDC047706 TaxID=3365486 RepID=UPI00372324BA
MMSVKRLIVTAAAIAGSLAFAAAPASADEQKWQTVSTNEWWSCSPYKSHRVSDNVNYKWCIVRNAGGYAQGVLVVQNKASVKVSIEGEILTNIPGGNEDCAPTTLGPGATRGCFGPTSYVGKGNILWVDVRLKLNNVDEWYEIQRG